MIQVDKSNAQYWMVIFKASKHSVDMTAVNSAIALALSEEVKPISQQAVDALWDGLLSAEPECMKYVSVSNGKTLVGVPAIFLLWADFAVALGDAVGFSDSSEDEGWVDDWITDAMPHIRAIFSALRLITMEYLAEASAAREAETGVNYTRIAEQSLLSGESFDQSLTRIRHAESGLKVID